MTAVWWALGAAFFAIGASMGARGKGADPAAARQARLSMILFYVAGALFLAVGLVGLARGTD